MDKTLATIQTYWDKIEKYPELATAIEELTEDHQERKRLEQGRRRMVRMADHEWKNYQAGASGFAQLLKKGIISGKISRKTATEYADIIIRQLGQSNDLIGLLRLADSTKEQLKENSSILNLEDLARKTSESFSDTLNQGRRKLTFQYNRPEEKPIKAYACKAVMTAIIGTLMGNCTKYALRGSNIIHGVDIHNKDLRIIFENDFEEGYIDPDGTHGKNRREGLPFVESMIRTMGGTFRRYNELQDPRFYDHAQYFGYQGDHTNTKGKIFGLSIRIPMSELTKPEESPVL